MFLPGNSSKRNARSAKPKMLGHLFLFFVFGGGGLSHIGSRELLHVVLTRLECQAGTLNKPPPVNQRVSSLPDFLDFSLFVGSDPLSGLQKKSLHLSFFAMFSRGREFIGRISIVGLLLVALIFAGLVFSRFFFYVAGDKLLRPGLKFRKTHSPSSWTLVTVGKTLPECEKSMICSCTTMFFSSKSTVHIAWRVPPLRK